MATSFSLFHLNIPLKEPISQLPSTFELVAEKVGGDTPVDPDPDTPIIPDPDIPVVPDNPGNGGNNLGLILGVSIPSGIVGIAGIAFLVIFLLKKRP